mmetsp:Transcript_116469/g.202584  ORF Transcript_116469/g.202584 Transcript_116469/m.202584 type:complete len:213 (+) Transcript_116469:366-1004(+)
MLRVSRRGVRMGVAPPAPPSAGVTAESRRAGVCCISTLGVWMLLRAGVTPPKSLNFSFSSAFSPPSNGVWAVVRAMRLAASCWTLSTALGVCCGVACGATVTPIFAMVANSWSPTWGEGMDRGRRLISASGSFSLLTWAKWSCRLFFWFSSCRFLSVRRAFFSSRSRSLPSIFSACKFWNVGSSFRRLDSCSSSVMSKKPMGALDSKAISLL